MKTTLSKRIYKIAGIPPGPIAAALIFFLLSLYMYLPYLENFSRVEYFFIIIPPIGALGCFLLSTCYVKTFSASILAGAIYAFCPLTLAFSAYHRFAGIPAAIIPWLFIPAAFIMPSKKLLAFPNAAKAVLAILAGLVIPLFFYLLTLPSIGPFFPMPLINAHLQNLAGIPLPLTGNAQDFVYGFYHLPLCAVIFGVLIYISAGSITLIIIAAVAMSLSFSTPIVQTPPIAWGLLAVMSCSILAAIGAENLIRAKKKFRLWALLCFILTAALSAIAFTNRQTLSGAIFAFAALLTAATIPISAKPANFRFAIWITFYTACCADILWGAKNTLEQIFGYGF
ncbi:MAG: hypothetical protein FVQ82_10195 [Planctomycetes bacterium]|nr:hypothetical protein [Planctomycetota bacterium]